MNSLKTNGGFLVRGIRYSVFGIELRVHTLFTSYLLSLISHRTLPTLFLLLAFTMNAQGQGGEGEIQKVEIEIVKDRQITLPKADRNFEKVPPRPAEPIKPEITYHFKNVSFTTPNYNPAIRPLKLKTEPISKIYGNYISVGYGNYASPYLEGYATTKRDKNKFYGAKLFHHSFGSGPVDSGNSASGTTELKVFGRTFSRSVVAGGFLSFENRNAKFYGELPGVFKGDASAQSYSVYSLGADVGNSSPADFNYNLRGGFSYLKDNFSSSESEINLNFTSAYKMDDKKKLMINADYFLISRKFASESRARHIFKVKPSYQFSPIDNLLLTVGVNTAFQNDTLGTVKSVNIYPNIRADYELNSNIQAYAALTGDIDKVSLHSLSRENLWLDQNVVINHTNRTFEFLAGLKGKLAGKFAFHTGLSFTNLKNLYFYQNDSARGQLFDVVYDRGNTTRTNLFGEVGFSSADKVKMLLRADIFGYSTDKQAEAWHRPTYRIGFTSSYNLYGKILFDVDMIAQGGMKALSIDQQLIIGGYSYKTVTINAALDLNLKASYLVSNQFSIFVKCNSVLNNQYQVYLYYPVRGLQAMAGLTWSF
jgi:hypothetical protein